jgi:hypothetical protein
LPLSSACRANLATSTCFALNGTRVETEPGNGVTISVEDSALRMQDEAIKTARIFTTKGII